MYMPPMISMLWIPPMIETPRSMSVEHAFGDAPAKVVNRWPSRVRCRQTSTWLRCVLNTYCRTTSALAQTLPHVPTSWTLSCVYSGSNAAFVGAVFARNPAQTPRMPMANRNRMITSLAGPRDVSQDEWRRPSEARQVDRGVEIRPAERPKVGRHLAEVEAHATAAVDPRPRSIRSVECGNELGRVAGHLAAAKRVECDITGR